MTVVGADQDIPGKVDNLLKEAAARQASDIHLEPTIGGYDIRLRVDGLLQTLRQVDRNTGRAMVGRVMAMAQLLTYRSDVPQEGRLTAILPGLDQPLQCRVSIMPTANGSRAALRLPAELIQPRTLGELSLPPRVLAMLERFLATDSGMLIVTGPAGSGKTTTLYALLQHLSEHSPGLSIVALEDPVERKLPGVTQIEVSPFGELTYERALRSILRQDPQVLMLGEIRDAATTSLAIGAALSGHRLISTMHAGTPAGTIARLVEMGVEPYQITSALFGIVAQRLLRKCASTGGYRGRIPVAEAVTMTGEIRKAVLDRDDASAVAAAYARQSGYAPMAQAADELVRAGLTDQNEVSRTLGTHHD